MIDSCGLRDGIVSAETGRADPEFGELHGGPRRRTLAAARRQIVDASSPAAATAAVNAAPHARSITVIFHVKPSVVAMLVRS